MVDLGHFIFILLVFLLSYGIASQSILYPNHPDPEKVIRGVLYRAYFQVFGELYLEAIEGENVTEIEDDYEFRAPIVVKKSIPNITFCLSE